jgi:thiosulfate/3-mercaptopyruvate sulfurtransferase
VVRNCAPENLDRSNEITSGFRVRAFGAPRNDEKGLNAMTTTDDPLVSTDWLAAHLDDPNVRIVDASFKLPGVLPLPKDDYLSCHLPHAVFFDVDAVSDHSNPLPHMYPSADQFGRDVGGLGIGNADTVVVYDSGGWVAAPRAWWMFLSYGHSNVRVLNGGLKKWKAEGRAVESGEFTAKPASFKASYDPKRVRSMEQLVANVGSRAEQVIDARAAERFEGRAPEPRPGIRSGHIPGARNVPYNQLFDAATGAMKPLDDLRQAFSGAGVKLDQPIVTSCGSGVSAGVLTLALYRLGVTDTALYDGSWSEWGREGGPAIATGPAV